MIFTFSNEMGEFSLYGSMNDGFGVCSVSGLEMLEPVRTLNSYSKEDGMIENTRQYKQRIITISGDLKVDDKFFERVRKMVRVLSIPSSLEIVNKEKKRKITVNAATITRGEINNSFQNFVIQLSCDYPHFSDISKIKTPIFKRNNLLKMDSVLPMILSERRSEGTVLNVGDIKIYPVVIITKKDDALRDSEIIIANQTTNKEIVIKKEMKKDEEIIVDIKNRTITSNIDGNILADLSLYSRLSDFWCCCGQNVISVFLGAQQSGMEVWVEYVAEYLEAI